jgi:hypothetical protein
MIILDVTPVFALPWAYSLRHHVDDEFGMSGTLLPLM